MHVATIVTECSRAFFASTAPQRIDFPDGTSARWREGTPGLDEEDVCGARGMRVAHRGCSLGPVRAGGAPILVAMLAALIAAVVRRWR